MKAVCRTLDWKRVHITVPVLSEAFYSLKSDVAAGVDGVTWEMYAEGLGDHLTDLHGRLHRGGAYRAPPVRRVEIPKPDGGKRPLGIATLEDKIVQKAVTDTILVPIYESEFLGFNYGFRPGRGAHNALDALTVGIERCKINWVLDADVRAFFDTVNRDWLVRFLEHRIGDKRVIRLISKWLNAGVMDGTDWTDTGKGVPQGAVVSPVLSNVYLHNVFDLWAQQWRKRKGEDGMIVVRYADDFVVGFQRQWEAESFLKDLKERLAKFGLDLHPDKTRLIEFGRFAKADRKRRGQGKPETFDCQSAFNGDPLSASKYDPPPGGWDRWGGVRDPLLLSEVETTAQPDLFYADHPRLPFHRCTTKRSFCNQTRWVKLDADFPPSGSSLQAFPHL